MFLIQFVISLLKKFLSKTIPTADIGSIETDANAWLKEKKEHPVAGKVIEYRLFGGYV